MKFVANLSSSANHQRPTISLRAFFSQSLYKFGLFLIGVFCMSNSFAEVILRFQSEIHDDASRLGDIVFIENDQAQWADLPLQSHPKPGEIITKDSVLEWIKPTAPHLQITWQGKTKTHVHRSIRSSGNLLISKAETAIRKQIASNYQQLTITPISATHDTEYAIDTFTTSFKSHYPIAKRVCVWLTPQQHPEQRIAVWFKIKAYKTVWVAKHHLHENEPLLPKHFFAKRMDIAGLKSQPVESIPTQALLKSSIDSHQILLKHHIKQRPLVLSGQPVKVTAHHASITITMEAIALEEGYLGQTISVKNPKNQETFVVRISGFQKAEITS